MTYIKGVMITLETGEDTRDRKGSGTDDHLYIGIHGAKFGGMEFALWKRKFDDFETGVTNYWAGYVNADNRRNGTWVECEFASAPYSYDAVFEDLKLTPKDVEAVYLRKQSHPRHDDDDAYKLKSIKVSLVYESTDPKVDHTLPWHFQTISPKDGWYLSNQTGLRVYLKRGEASKD